MCLKNLEIHLAEGNVARVDIQYRHGGIVDVDVVLVERIQHPALLYQVQPAVRGEEGDEFVVASTPDNTVHHLPSLEMNRLAYYNRLPIADIGLERFNKFIPIQTSDQKLILEPNRSKGLSVW